MNQVMMALLAMIGSASVYYTDVPEKMQALFDDSVESAQLVCTAGDLHSMSVMLDATYVMDRRLPKQKDFEAWLERSFKENNVKSLLVDQWGEPYVYTVSSHRRTYQLRSSGPDMVMNTDDDLIKSGP